MPGTSGSVPEPVQVPKAEMPTHSPALALQVGIAIVVGLYLAREVLMPITLAVLLSFLLSPVVGWLRRIYLPRLAAVFLAVIAALATAAAVGGLIGSEVAGLAPDVPRYASTIQTKVETDHG
jgi:predicted PurR-regulated permease PerM